MEDMATWKKDLLTNCYLREYLKPYLEKLKIESSVMNKTFSVMMVDLDRLKPMNDKYGHSCGDDMIKYFSSSLRLYLEVEDATAMPQNMVFRYGGDEFLIVFPGENSKEVAKMANRILKEGMKKNRLFLYHARNFEVTYSGGIASFPSDARDIDELIDKADKAMYFSKKHGKARISIYSMLAFESIKRIVGSSLLFVAFSFALAMIFLSVNGVIRNFVFVDRILKFNTPRPERLQKIYLKSGAVIEGVIVNGRDPIGIKLIMDTGEGMIYVHKSEIEKITSIDTAKE